MNKVTISVDAERLATVIALISDLTQTADNLWPLDENQLQIGPGGITFRVWTLTVGHDGEMYTTVHPTEREALECLTDNYGEDWEKQGIQVNTDRHSVTIPYKRTPR